MFCGAVTHWEHALPKAWGKAAGGTDIQETTEWCAPACTGCKLTSSSLALLLIAGVTVLQYRPCTRRANTMLYMAIAKVVLVDLLNALAPEDKQYFRQSREEKFGQTLEEVRPGMQGCSVNCWIIAIQVQRPQQPTQFSGSWRPGRENCSAPHRAGPHQVQAAEPEVAGRGGSKLRRHARAAFPSFRAAIMRVSPHQLQPHGQLCHLAPPLIHAHQGPTHASLFVICKA